MRPASAASSMAYSESARTSWTWTILPSNAALPTTEPDRVCRLRARMKIAVLRFEAIGCEYCEMLRPRAARYWLSLLGRAAPRIRPAFEHRLQVKRRAADDLEHVGGGSLLLQATSRSSLSSRVFSMAITACAAKFWTSSICLSVNGRTSWR